MSELPSYVSSTEPNHSPKDLTKTEDTPRSQGQIITQNPDLLKLLNEDSDPTLTVSRNGTENTNNSNSAVSQLLHNVTEVTGSDKEPVSSDSDTNQHTDISESRLVDNTDIVHKTGIGSDSKEDHNSTSRSDTGRGTSRSRRVSHDSPADVIPRRRNISNIQSSINPDILRASGLSPLDDKYFFPKYVSLKSSVKSFEGFHSEDTALPSHSEDTALPSHSEDTALPSHSEDTALPSYSEDTALPSHSEDTALPSHSEDTALPSHSEDTALPSHSEDTALPSPLQSDRSLKTQTEPVSTDSDPFVTKADYPSFEKDENRSSLTDTEKDRNDSEKVKDNDKDKSEKQYLLVPVKIESPKRQVLRSSSTSKVSEDLSSETVMDSNKPRRIYIEPPDPDEDDDIRFVSSRIDDYDDKADTYRQLDEAVVSETSLRPSRSGKHVRYEDSDRYEDRSHSVAAPTPVRGVPLPVGPKLDPADEIALSREQDYQNSLKERVRESERHVSEIEVPKLPLSTEDNGEFVGDSLEYSEDTYRQNRSSMARDSLELYDGLSARERERIQVVEKDAWSNPPPEPFGQSDQQPPLYDGYREYGQENIYVQEPGTLYPAALPPGYYGDSWQQTAYIQRGDAIERYDVAVEQQFISHQMPMPAGNYDHVYIHPDVPQEEHSYTQERFGVENPGGGNFHSPPQSDIDDRRGEKQGSKKLQAEPEKPQYDYVSNNKYDYGKQPRRTYRQIQDIKAEEKVKLETVFIKPKPKKSSTSKLPVLNRPQPQPQHHEMNREEPVVRRSPSNKAASAENLWDNRSAFLADHKNGKVNQKKKLVKYPSESGLSSRRPEEGGKFASAPPHDRMAMMLPLSAPLSPGRQALVMKPITQEIITDDGQKIIVDVKLRLSPGNAPPGEYLQFGQSPSNPGPYGVGVPYGFADAADDRVNPAVQQYAPRQISTNQYHPYTGYDVPRNGEFKENRDVMSPYSKIPPIPKSGESQLSQFETNLDGPSWQESESDSEGYAAQFKKSKMKKKEKPWYTIYNIDDYRRMQKEVRLGTLGPDLDSATFRERMDKKMRQEEYARQVKLKNQKNLAHRKPPTFPRPKETNDIMNKRKVAVEYAKNVPKPSPKPRVTKYNSYELASQVSLSPKGQPGKETLEFIDLDKLQQRHEKDKQNVATIRQNMGSDRAVSQNA
ncbi:uncharacterized protein LOC121386561 [Gigantopelta aegis]|uniref:uncharacterized protein LOC121386561 n=1 Tax=Gigantopelta aegis TaxID=1735272 RepID=UPI001B887914|nr:uncharacterized protein LOC121386561 [Gigantopelta aegis]